MEILFEVARINNITLVKQQIKDYFQLFKNIYKNVIKRIVLYLIRLIFTQFPF